MQIIVCKLVVLLRAIGNKATKPTCFSAMAGTTKMLRQAGRIMKLTAILILGACLQIHAAGYGQKITLSEKDAPIEKVLKKIQEQTDYKFLYTSQLLEGTPKVTIIVKNAPVEEVLDLMFKDEKLDYEVNERTIVIRPRKEVHAKETVQATIKEMLEVRGVITDENGVPAQGVNITLRGTKSGTTTNIKGEFILNNVDESAVLIITSVGYDKQEIKVDNKTFISIQLRLAIGTLDELQVIAYGTTSKRLQTGNVTSIKSAEIEKQPVNNPLLALTGRVPGLEITQSTGLPGSGVVVRIQGQNSIGKGNDPLYVIDGVPYVSQLLTTNVDGMLGNSGGMTGTAGSPLSYINPADIESIDVLKDADATSIFGSRAANGAIMITTKKGKSGKTKLEINFQNGWGVVTRKLDLMNTRQYLNMRYEALKNDGLNPDPTFDFDLTLWDTTRYTDWQKKLIGGRSQFTTAQSTISGGNTNTQYLIGAGFRREATVFPGDFKNDKVSVHTNISSMTPNAKFKIEFSSSFLLDRNLLPNVDFTATSIGLSPNAPEPYNIDGSLNWAPLSLGSEGTWENPFAALNNTYNNTTKNLFTSSILTYTLTKGLVLRSNFGYTDLRTDANTIIPQSAIDPGKWLLYGNILRTGNYARNSISSWIIEPQISYSSNLGIGKFEVLAGGTLNKVNSDGSLINANNFISDDIIEDLKGAGNINIVSTIKSIYKYNALFGRANYNFRDKYIANFTFRRDGSSRFGSVNRFHNFGSVSGVWIFNNEDLIKNNLKFLSFGKLRVSYGTTGNDQIGDYQYMDLFTPISASVLYQGATGLGVNRLANPYLEWEETKKLQAGIELGFAKDRVLVTANYFNNRSSNQLLSYNLPVTAGFSNIVTNFPATVQNSGWELTLNGNIYESKAIKWSSSFNITFPKNELLSFPDFEGSPYSTTLIVGKPINILQLYRFGGVDPSTGLYTFLNKDGISTSSPNFLTDRTAIVDIFPKFYGGFSNTIRYRSLEFSVFFQFAKQLGGNYSFGAFPGTATNQPIYLENRWRKAGDVASHQIVSSQYNASVYNAYDIAANRSNSMYADASYIRLKNVSVSWDLATRWRNLLNLTNANLFVNAQNILTITKYKGLDPETRSNGNTASLPPLKVITFGIKLTF